MKKNIIVFLLLVLLSANYHLNAQNMSDMLINEILVTNTDDFVDSYGNRSGWIELFNTSYGTVDIGGCYITNDADNLTKYMIPRGDILTKVRPRQHILFFADDMPKRGTFHLNFKLEDSKEIILVSSDGRTIIDRIAIPHQLLSENISFGRAKDGEDIMLDKKTVDHKNTWVVLEHTSPSTNNSGVDSVPTSLIFMEVDPYGGIMAFTAMSIVFTALIMLYLLFKYVGKYNISLSRKKSGIVSTKSDKKVVGTEETHAEVYAAIASALHSFYEDEEVHDIENTILTIQKVTKNYSPWSSKIYTLRETPNKK